MTDGIGQWIIDLPVWIQAPLVLAVLVPVACGVAAVLTMVVGRILPTSAAERRVFGTDPVSAGAPEDELSDVPSDVHGEEGESR